MHINTEREASFFVLRNKVISQEKLVEGLG